MILWENFDRNEWYILAMLVISYAAVVLVPRKVPKRYLVLGLLWGFASSTLFDFTIGGGMMDFYRVNDSHRYELTDLLTYFMFAPFGYFFVNFYEMLNIGKRKLLIYILGWTIVAVGMQWVSEWMGMTHYQRGYKLEYNVVVFLIIQTITGLVYAHLKTQPVKRNY
ncbi:hypothetical protein [Paenibacillus sp.]|uniref:hypothetical protein n=1 Tax=Paenibacillus sp. TaxID=58172 RepID=UPI002D739C20|nr:hypothetical protein [Paenibacillus sp.]HZG84315.1 hypothetical protein [Paenibacillus sp.]